VSGQAGVVQRRRAYLLRHAKSSWADPELRDRDRPLARRGVKATRLLREYIRRQGIAPDLVLCSRALRAVQTLEGVRDVLPPATEIEIEDGLYAAGADPLLDRVRQAPERAGSLMLVAHNPGIEELALALAGGGDADALERLRTKYPTGGLATLSFEGDWGDLGPGGARLEELVVPRELKAALK
jgi:phosphohistidine phosphatase